MFEAAHLVKGNTQVRFHGLRKYLCDRLSSVASSEQWKRIVGKSVSKSDSTYLSDEQLKESFTRVMPLLAINGESKNHVKIEQLEAALQSAEDTIKTLRTRLEAAESTGADNKTTIQQQTATIQDLVKRLEKLEKAK